MGAMSEFSQWLIGRSGYADDGFAAAYDRFRPRPPAVVLDVLTRCAGGGQPRLVVDLGCGTGLSTRAWAGRADRVVGVEANPAMAAQADTAPDATELEYIVRYADDTGLVDRTADIVTCAQSFHWMDPAAVLPEAARILRGGGVFGAYDYDVVPVIEPSVDAAFAANVAARGAARERLGLEAGSSTWPKHGHLGRMRDSGLFAQVREVHCHTDVELDADHLVGMAYSIGGPVEIFGDEAPEVSDTLDVLTATAERVLGDRAHPAVIGYTIRLGITPS
jgi:SAM-dependent methyltransferase